MNNYITLMVKTKKGCCGIAINYENKTYSFYDSFTSYSEGFGMITKVKDLKELEHMISQLNDYGFKKIDNEIFKTECMKKIMEL